MTLEEKYKHELYLAKRDGKAEGAAEEKNRINTLIQLLLKDGRLDDLRRSTADPDYQLQLFEEFGL